MTERVEAKFDDTPRYGPDQVRWVLSRVRGKTLSDRTWMRYLKYGRVSRDEDKMYGPSELVHLMDLAIHLLHGGTYGEFEEIKFGGGPKPVNPAQVDVQYEVI
ncbi:MAG: hypothetical protein AAGD25_06585 [Cyanobacteria bacterium P01_F01_bin.150]